MDYTDLCIEKDLAIRDAMRQLSNTARKILFVREDGFLSGALTDGDIRRYLLNGGKLGDAVCAAMNRHPITAKSKKQARALLQRQRDTIFAVPVIEESGALVDIVFSMEAEEVSLPSLALPVVIMAGGKGTRLDPYTRVLPKPLIPVGNLPIIEHIMLQFEKYHCNDFRIIVNYKKQLIKAYFHESEQSYKVRWYDEEQPLGTGGGLSLLKGELQETFFLTNCDTLLCADYSDILRFHRKSGNTITMIGVYKNLTVPYGVLDIKEGGVVEAMREKPELSFLTNTGMYMVEPEVLKDIPDHTALGFPDIIEGQRQKGRKVAVYPVDEDAWMDMGQMTELEKMRKQLYGE